MKHNPPWMTDDFVDAMNNAVSMYAHPKLVRKYGDKIIFNGFWRNGDKQNICLWIKNAMWHDIKTGEGGGCKEFAKTAFNMTLPDFMKRFGEMKTRSPTSNTLDIGKIFSDVKEPSLIKSINLIWSEINSAALNNSHAIQWLENERGFHNVTRWVRSGFTALHERHIPYFETRHHDFLKHRLQVGTQLIVPLRSTHSDEVKNIVFRSISSSDDREKIRLLPNAGGWREPGGSPRAFGFPHLIENFPNLILCEGMADYFAAECLLEGNENYLPLGAANADALSKWAEWLVARKYSGSISVIYHLDRNQQGKLSKSTAGPSKALQALAMLKRNRLHAHIFDWLTYIENITTHPTEISDLADCLKAEATYQECGTGHLPYLFLSLLNFEEHNRNG